MTLPTESAVATSASSNVAPSGSLLAEDRGATENCGPLNGEGTIAEEASVERDGMLVASALVYWTPEYLGKEALTAEQWERRVCRESYAGTIRFGNHKCRRMSA